MLARDGESLRAADLADRAIAIAGQIKGDTEPYRRWRSRLLLLPDSDTIKVTVVKPRNLIGRGERRALEGGRLIGPFIGADLTNVTALILPEVVGVLTQVGQDERAEQIVMHVVARARNATRRGEFGSLDFLLAQAAGALARAGRVVEARSAAEAINNPLRSAEPLAIVAAELSKTGQKDQAIAVADKAIIAAQSLRGTAYYDEILANKVSQQASGERQGFSKAHP